MAVISCKIVGKKHKFLVIEKGSYRGILDTGASVNIINNALSYEKYGEDSLVGFTGEQTVPIAKSFLLGDTLIRKPYVANLDYLKSYLGFTPDFVLGTAFLIKNKINTLCLES